MKAPKGGETSDRSLVRYHRPSSSHFRDVADSDILVANTRPALSNYQVKDTTEVLFFPSILNTRPQKHPATRPQVQPENHNERTSPLALNLVSSLETPHHTQTLHLVHRESIAKLQLYSSNHLTLAHSSKLGMRPTPKPNQIP
jgi:hypothetical protein